MEKKLLLLGLLLSHEMHGYQLNDLLQHSPSSLIPLKKSNAYKLLGDMEKEGWVTHVMEQEGNRPQRRVYSVTETGKTEFFRLLRENIASNPSPEFPGAVGFDFLHMLPEEETTQLLQKRLTAVTEKFQQLDEIPAETRKNHLSVAYLHHFYQNEISWLTQILKNGISAG